MPLVEGSVLIESLFGDTSTTVIPGPVSVISVGAQGPQGIPGPGGTVLTAETSVDLLTLGRVVAVQSDGTLVLADPTDSDQAYSLVGMNVSTGHAGDMIEYILNGEVTGLSSLSPGQLYFLGLNGTLSVSPTAMGATWQRALGNAVSLTKFALDKQNPVLLS